MLIWLLTVPPGWLSHIPYTLGASLITLTGASALGQYIRMAMTALEFFLGHSGASISPAGLSAPGCLPEQVLARAELEGHSRSSRAEPWVVGLRRPKLLVDLSSCSQEPSLTAEVAAAEAL